MSVIFERLKLFKLNANRGKCVFVRASVSYLGHLITPQGIGPDPSKISAIADRKKPTNVKQVMSFLQTCSWFRRFVPDFAQVARPLSELTRKNAVWTWGDEQDKAYKTLQQLLTSAPILRTADPKLPYTLRTDASSYALGACLLQGEGKDERPIEYASRLLSSAERNYSTTEREALAVVFAVQKFRGYLDGASVTIATDHQPLRWLMSLRSPSGRLARWALILQEFDLKIEYTPGRSNLVADTLSRPPCHDVNVDVCAICSITVTLPTESPRITRENQLEDPDVGKIIRCFESDSPNEIDHTRWTDRGYILMNGVLHRYHMDGDEAQLVVPRSKVEEVLKLYHDSPLAGHYGVDKTYQRVASRYYWPTLRRDLEKHVKVCLQCQRYKPTNLKPAGLLQTPVLAQRFEVLAMDLVGPLPEVETGEKWIFVIEDTSTKWVELFPLKQATANNCAAVLINEIILRYGTPRRVISDNGSQFVGEVMQQVAYGLGFKQNLTPLYHPAANPEERRNRDIKTQLSIFVGNDHTKWREALPAIRFAMNSARHSATGFTPAYLTFGRELRTPDDVNRDMRAILDNDNFVAEITPYLRTIAETLRRAREAHELHQDSKKRHADHKRRDGQHYEVGDQVLVKTHVLSKASSSFTSKFAPRRDGPYLVIEKISPTSYRIATPGQENIPLGVYHESDITPYHTVDDTLTPAPVQPIRKRGRPRHMEGPSQQASETPDDNVLCPPSPEPKEVEPRSGEILCPPQPPLETGYSQRVRKPAAPCTAPCCASMIEMLMPPSLDLTRDGLCDPKGEYVAQQLESAQLNRTN
uniref:RNA-directed DNA polymerase n=1 Tax=Photinus pyralis TaxID=7054 RepID=A0A1Y1KT95_PHOPY